MRVLELVNEKNLEFFSGQLYFQVFVILHNSALVQTLEAYKTNN